MRRFQQRSQEKELLDADEIPVADLHRNLFELNRINTLLGGHAVTLQALQSFTFDPNQTYHVLDIGCGGGDNLRVIAQWARQKGLHFRLTGVDLKADCISYARVQCAAFPEIDFIQSDYALLPLAEMQVDIAFACLFNHHLTDEQNQFFLWFCRENVRMGLFINDLHRHPFAYYSIAWLTQLFSRSYLVKNDAPLSVWRGFSRKELQALATQTLPAATFQLRWRWAFRWVLVFKQTNNAHV